MSDRADDESPSTEGELLADAPSFVRTYVATFVLRVLGAVAFVGGCAVALLARTAGAGLVVAGAALLIGGSVASVVSGYRVLRSAGYPRYPAWARSRPWSTVSLGRYREYRALLGRSAR
jgi:hypothetical protein